MKRVGIISDTHGYCHSRVYHIFKDVDLIIHAGDIGDETVVSDLEALAPVKAVVGNMDGPPLRDKYPSMTEVSVEGRLLIVTHQAGPPERLSEELKALVDERKPAVLIFGHTHLPLSRHQGGVLYLNPGYAGWQRFGWKRSVAVLYVTDTGVEAVIHSLEDMP